MKKIFYGSTYLLMLVIIFTYMVMSKDIGNDYGQSLLEVVGETGVSIIGFLFLFPAFIFTTLSLCVNKKMLAFCRDLFSLFTSVFCLATGIIGIFMYSPFYYIPIIVIIASLVVLILSLINVISSIKNEDRQVNG